MFLAPPPATAYIVSLIDSCSRIAWAEVLASKKALPVMFKTLKMINTLNFTYGLVFQEILSDNGSDEDVIEGATFDNLDHFAKELFDYMIYYNNHRPHQALARTNPKGFAATKTTAIQSAN